MSTEKIGVQWTANRPLRIADSSFFISAFACERIIVLFVNEWETKQVEGISVEAKEIPRE